MAVICCLIYHCLLVNLIRFHNILLVAVICCLMYHCLLVNLIRFYNDFIGGSDFLLNVSLLVGQSDQVS